VNTAAENARPGTTGWWGAPHAPPGAIEAYTTQPSVVAGDTISLCVSTRPAARYRARVYRLGWYGGDGGRLMASPPGNVGLARESPEPDLTSGIVRAGWPVTDVIQTDEDWSAGQYAIVLELTSGAHAGTAARVPFVVRALPGEVAQILVQMPINTTQAYNHWGGKCLYDSNSTDQVAAVKVSFDRPVLAWDLANLNSRSPFVYDLPLIRWLEREGFDVAYQTNVDTHREPASLTGPRLIVTSGHDEYWTREMRDAFDDAQARGVSLAFMGANTCYWQIRYEDDERTIVEYRSGTADPEQDPTEKTMRFRHLGPPRPERELIGQQYEGGLVKPSEARDFRFMPGLSTDSWAAGVQLEPERPLSGLVGYEWDTFDERHTPPGCVRMFRCDGPDQPADAIHWTARSGSRIFAAGSLQFTWGLDDWAAPGMADARLQQVMRTGFREMLS
jgi:hypothetical protein